MIGVTTPDGVRHEFPDGSPPDKIRAALAAQGYAKAAPDTSSQSSQSSHAPASDNPPNGSQVSLEPEAASFLHGYAPTHPDLNGLPALGGLVGGLGGFVAGGPLGGIAGAGIGGAWGEGMRASAHKEHVSGGRVLGQGALQAGLEATGLGLTAGALKLAPGLTQKSLGIVSTLAKRFKMKPEEIAQIVHGERVGTSLEGEQALMARGNALRTTRNTAIQGASGKVTAKTLAKVAIRDAEAQALRPLTQSEKQVIIDKVQAEADQILSNATHGAIPKAKPGTAAQPPSTILNQHGQPAIPGKPAIPPRPSRYSPWEVEQVKEGAAKQAKGDFLADQAGTSINADPALQKQIASGARKRLNKAVPGVKEANARLSKLKAGRLAILDATSKSTGEWTPLKVGPVSVGVNVPRKSIGDLALFLSHPKTQAMLRQSPRAVAALVMQMMHSAQPDVTK